MTSPMRKLAKLFFILVLFQTVGIRADEYKTPPKRQRKIFCGKILQTLIIGGPTMAQIAASANVTVNQTKKVLRYHLARDGYGWLKYFAKIGAVAGGMGVLFNSGMMIQLGISTYIVGTSMYPASYFRINLFRMPLTLLITSGLILVPTYRLHIPITSTPIEDVILLGGLASGLGNFSNLKTRLKLLGSPEMFKWNQSLQPSESDDSF